MTLGDRLRGLRQRVIATRTGRLTLRIVVGIIGLIFVVVGLVLVPLPGPGWLIVLLGLAIWAIEFDWARHLLEYTRRQLERWWQWLNRQHWSIRVLVGLSTLAFVAAVSLTSLAISLDVDSPGALWSRLTPW
jgi:uncharacterized protein (TIGR02611 family)